MEIFRVLSGEPHDVAMGMAIGVFVSMTPTIPFHMIIAIFLAHIMRVSKTSAAIGVWFSNPLTLPLFYYGSYKVGRLLTGQQTDDLLILGNLVKTFQHSGAFSLKYQAIHYFLMEELHTFGVMILGGIILGIIPGVVSYILTHKFITRLRSEGKKS